MASAEAQKAKDRGNAAFKRGDYPEAVGHYSAAIVADRSDATYPLNRAAAYLKLGKHDDAERDCTTVLRLKPGNVKALYRRAQARTELGKLSDATVDLQQALKHEPSNESVKTELARVIELLAKSKTPKQPKIVATKSAPIKSIGVPAPSKRRRIPIHAIENEPPSELPLSQASDDPLKPIATRRLTPNNPVVPTTPAPPLITPKTNSASAETPQPAVRGGIFRSSGAHTLFNALNQGTASPASSSAVKTEDIPPSAGKSKSNIDVNARPAKRRLSVMPTLFDFTKVWNSTEDPLDKWHLFSQLPPQRLPSFFKASLDSSFLASLLGVFSQVLDSAENKDGAIAEQVKEYMFWFKKVQRFAIVLMFFDERENAIAKGVVERLGGVDGWSF